MTVGVRLIARRELLKLGECWICVGDGGVQVNLGCRAGSPDMHVYELTWAWLRLQETAAASKRAVVASPALPAGTLTPRNTNASTMCRACLCGPPGPVSCSRLTVIRAP